MITVVPYRAAWQTLFEQYRTIYAQALGTAISGIEHVGSTSVVGLWAKPILDIDIIIDDRAQLPAVIAGLQRLGYEHRGDYGVPDRDAFKPLAAHVPLPNPQAVAHPHHLYVCLRGSDSLENHLRLRDYLRSHPAAVAEYGLIKQALAKRFPDNISAYVDGKTDFIVGILAQCGMPADALAAIRKVNEL